MFYILDQDAEIEGSAAVDGLPESIDPIDWIRGKIMPAPPKDLVLELSEASGAYRGAIFDGLITLYHDTLKKALTEFGVNNIQYFPVQLRNPTMDTLESGYWIANIIGLIECVDRENSILIPLPSGTGEDLGPFQIAESKTKGAPLFRLAESPTLVIVTEKLVDHLIASDICGVRARDTKTEFWGALPPSARR
ncbi:MAG: hypothetical protein HY080_08095 [Gammaproteobacteria bacterium]|nr:hypothetical protein [Gammaproteobacteria bacterium]